MDREFRAFLEIPDPGVKPARRRRSFNAFGWTVFLLLLTGAVMASWITSFYVYNHPENPDCYHLLKQLNRLDPPRRFEITAAPVGKFFTAKELYDTYLTMSPEDLNAKNSELLRNYLRNYADVKTPVPYLCGDFTTTAVYELGKTDMFPTGMVAVADSKDCPQVQIEHLYPTAFANVPRARQMLAADPDIRLEKSFSLATIVHVGKLADGRMLFTVMPLDYGPYAYKQGISSTFRLDPPSVLNLEASLPVVKPESMDNAMKAFALYRKNRSMLAKEQMLTLPPAPPAAPATVFSMAQDVPAEAYQPYTPPAPAPPASEPAPESDAVAVTTNPPVTTPPADDMPPATAPASDETQTAPAPPAAPEPPPAAATMAASSPTGPVAQPIAAAQPPPVLQTAPVLQPAPAARMIAAPAIAKTSPPVSPRLAASAPANPALPHTSAPVTLGKATAKTASALPPPALAVRPVSRTQPPLSQAEIIAALQRTAAASKSRASTSYTSANPSTASVNFAADSVPIPTAVHDQPYPSPVPVQYAEAVPPQVPASGVKLQPFMADRQPEQPAQSQQQPVAATRDTTWQTYHPGMMPHGKLINMNQAPQLAELGVGGENVYVQGRFLVTASSDGRAVLRPVDYNGSLSGATIRMVVQYPSGARVPAEGSQVARGAYRPFQIVDVHRGEDGQVNIYAREVTVPVDKSSGSPYALRNYNRYRYVQQDYNSRD